MFSFLAFIWEVLFFVGYVGQTNSFPPPLDKEEEKKYIRLLADGDEQAREKLIVHNLRLVAHIAKKYNKVGRDTDDVISVGTIGLIKAVSTFSADKGALSSYASKCIENEILMSLRVERKQVYEVSLDEPIGTDRDGNELALSDLMGADAETVFDQVQAKIDADILQRVMKKTLDKREELILNYRFGLTGGYCMPQREVAKLLDISRSYVSRIEKKAMRKMLVALRPYYD
ncbi:MAG: RNA polymerase sporulation sigma factor SigK [Eubacteriales bacterium]|nr:RNA polymerase sporulation sigma factor SigK [Eubacteriales bacterium]